MSDEPKKRRPRKPDQPMLVRVEDLNPAAKPESTIARQVRQAVTKGGLNLPPGRYALILVRDTFNVAEQPTVERVVTDT